MKSGNTYFVLIYVYIACCVYISQAYYTTKLPTSTTDKYSNDNDDKSLIDDTVDNCKNIETPPREWTERNIPNPQTDTCRCGRDGKRSWICDPNNLMSYEQANRIDDAIERLRGSTGGCTCGSKKCSYVSYDYGGFQAAVVIVSALYVKSGDRAINTVADLAEYLRDEYYEFGACNDDLVILMSDQDRVVYTATGEMTRQIVTDQCVQDITDAHKADLGAKRYGIALKGMIEDYNLALQREHSCNKPMGAGGIAAIVAIVVGGIISCITCAYCSKKCGWCKNCNSSGGGSRSHYSGGGRRGSCHSAKSASSGGGGASF